MERDVKIPLGDCIKGRLYHINARNFRFGVFDGEVGFIGIREKWGSRYLDTESHWDTGSGTVWGIVDTGIQAPPELVLMERLPGSQDGVTGRMVDFREAEGDSPKGWYFLDTGELADSKTVRPQTIPNPDLFEWLEARWKDEVLQTVCPTCNALPGAECTDPDYEGVLHAARRYPR